MGEAATAAKPLLVPEEAKREKAKLPPSFGTVKAGGAIADAAVVVAGVVVLDTKQNLQKKPEKMQKKHVLGKDGAPKDTAPNLAGPAAGAEEALVALGREKRLADGVKMPADGAVEEEPEEPVLLATAPKGGRAAGARVNAGVPRVTGG